MQQISIVILTDGVTAIRQGVLMPWEQPLPAHLEGGAFGGVARIVTARRLRPCVCVTEVRLVRLAGVTAEVPARVIAWRLD
jgi:hypothetical protein